MTFIVKKIPTGLSRGPAFYLKVTIINVGENVFYQIGCKDVVNLFGNREGRSDDELVIEICQDNEWTLIGEVN